MKGMNRKLPLLLLALILFACSPATVESVVGQITPPAVPDEGKATVVGRVINKNGSGPIVDATIRLAEVFREGEGGAFVVNLATSPSTRTDAEGYYIIENIPPGEYVIAVGEGESMAEYDVIEDSTGKQARVWMATAGQVNDWGEVQAEVLFRYPE
jgi:hypothetical protein